MVRCTRSGCQSGSRHPRSGRQRGRNLYLRGAPTGGIRRYRRRLAPDASTGIVPGAVARLGYPRSRFRTTRGTRWRHSGRSGHRRILRVVPCASRPRVWARAAHSHPRALDRTAICLRERMLQDMRSGSQVAPWALRVRMCGVFDISDQLLSVVIPTGQLLGCRVIIRIEGHPIPLLRSKPRIVPLEVRRKTLPRRLICEPAKNPSTLPGLRGGRFIYRIEIRILSRSRLHPLQALQYRVRFVWVVWRVLRQ